MSDGMTSALRDGRENTSRLLSYGCDRLGRLTDVLVHTPGKELELLTESNFEALLFDSVPDIPGFIEEHERYCDMLRLLGVTVHQVRDFVPDGLIGQLPNLTYLHDVAVISSRGAILSKMTFPGRLGEEVVVREALDSMGIPIWIDFDDPGDGFEGCLLLDESSLLVAETERHRNGSVLRLVECALEDVDEVLYIDVPDARRYMHPDTVFNRVRSDLALAYPPAFEKVFLFTKDGVRETTVEAYTRARGVELLPVSDEEQQRLACSFVPIDDGVMVHYDTALSPRTVRKLERRGVEIHTLHPDALVAGGGSLRCITLRLHREGNGQELST
jgi:arginine deiminase